MGYELHITRRNEWSDEGEPSITLEEWKSYIKSDPEMRLDNFAEAKVGGGKVLRIDEEGLAVWLKYSKHSEHDGMAWFSYGQGNVSVKNPDEEIIQKMVSIADALSARVQGDEGEFYPEQPISPSAGSPLESAATGVAFSPWVLVIIAAMVVVAVSWKWLTIR